jgi:hypothetical protein
VGVLAAKDACIRDGLERLVTAKAVEKLEAAAIRERWLREALEVVRRANVRVQRVRAKRRGEPNV